mmetsp:Transcript_28026/g.80813  ORF Transcript_28026/g.80813 Transcript_28026/m.80813 type:complete len:402 (+) Transcript_28026:88-1293(+)
MFGDWRALDSMLTIDRQYFFHSFRDGLQFTINAAFTKDNHYTLFRYEDWPAWVTFTAVFTCLIVFDNTILNRGAHKMSILRAVCVTLFWIACACAFCGWVWWWYGPSQAFMWMSGYMLEWMLSFDNLFVFHLIFTVYGTPDHLKHRPLYLGIIGAVVFRLVFIFVGEYLMHAMFLMHFLFGAFLVYSGVKTVTADEEDDDPSRHPLVRWLQARVPFVSCYDDGGAFFVRTSPEAPNGPQGPQGQVPEGPRYGTVDFPRGGRGQLKATMLFLVVVCLEVSDLLFAVDSVSAIVAQVNDLFLAYTSAVFAMLGLRATYFIIDELVQLFALLKYGVGAVLVFIGVKLILERLYRIPPSVVCLVLVACIGSSMVASVIQERARRQVEGKSRAKRSPAAAQRLCSA